MSPKPFPWIITVCDCAAQIGLADVISGAFEGEEFAGLVVGVGVG